MNGRKSTLASPAVIVPAAVGAFSLGLAFFLGSPGGLLGIVGICGLLGAAGMAFTRWVYVTGPLAESIDQALQREANRNERNRLDQLQRTSRDDPDPALRDNLGKLRQLNDRLQAVPHFANDPLLAEVRNKLFELYESCLGNLQRVAEQGAAARQVSTPEARETLLRARAELLKQVAEGIDRVGAGVDQIQVALLANDASGQRTAQIRDELEAGLEVARRVQERMSEFDRRVAER